MTSRRRFFRRFTQSAAGMAAFPFFAASRPEGTGFSGADGASRSAGAGMAPVLAGSAATDRGDRVLDVTDFGADPSGETDSAAAFQAALEAAPDTGARVRVPRGRYRVAGPVVWPTISGSREVLKPSLLEGDNPSSIKGVPNRWSAGISAVVHTGSGPLFDLRSGSMRETDFRGGFRDLALHGSGAEGTVGIQAHNVWSAQFVNLMVRNFGVNVGVSGAGYYSIWENCSFTDANSDGARFEGALNGSGFYRVRFASNGRHGVLLRRPGVPVQFDGCWFERNGSYGVRTTETIHVRVAASYFEGNEKGSISMVGISGADVTGTLTVMDSYFRPLEDRCCVQAAGPGATLRLVNYNVNTDHCPASVVDVSRCDSPAVLTLGGERYGANAAPLVGPESEEGLEIVALADRFAADTPSLGASNVVSGHGSIRFRDTPVRFPSHTDKSRPSPGEPGRVIFNSDDGTLNIDTGEAWVVPDGEAT